MAPSAAAHRFRRNSAFGTLAGVTAALTSFLSSVIVAHVLGVERTGVVAFAIWVATFTATIADLGIQSSLSRYLPELTASRRRHEARALAALLMRLAGTSCLAAFALFAGCALWLRHESGVWSAAATMALLIGAACAFQALAGCAYGRLRGLQQFDRLAGLSLLSLALQLVAVALGSMLFGAAGAVAGYCMGSVVPAGCCLFAAGDACVTRELKARVIRFAVFAWAGGLASAFVWSRIEVFFLERSVGDAAVGLFTVGLSLANLAVQGPMLLTAGLLPYFSERFGNRAFGDMRAAFAAATRVLAFLVLPACFGLAAVMPAVLPLIYGGAFAEAVPAAILMVVAAGFGAIGFVGANLVLAIDRSDFTFACGLGATVLAVAAGLTVIPYFGVIGAAGGRAAIQLGTVGFGSWFIVRRLGYPVPFAELGRLILAALLCAAVARACLLLWAGPAGLAAAIPAAIASYFGAVRALSALPDGDIARLRSLVRDLPAPVATSLDFALVLLSRRAMRPDQARHGADAD